MLSLRTHWQDAVQIWKERLSCSAPECHGSRRVWDRISDSMGSARLHGRRYCYPTCFEQELGRRITGMRVSSNRSVMPPHRVPLGLLMLARGELNHEQLRHALEEQKRHGCGRIGEWIQRLGYAQESQITPALGVQWSCPVLPALPVSIADCEIPLQLLQRFGMVPIHYSRRISVVHMAFASSIDYRALLAIEQMLECKAQPCLASATAVQSYLERLDEAGNRGTLSFGDVGGPDHMIRIISSYAAKLTAQAVRLVGCAEYVWVKIEGTKEAVNLIFEQSSAEAALDYRMAKVT